MRRVILAAAAMAAAAAAAAPSAHAQDWHKIDCAASKLSAEPAGECWQGPPNNGGYAGCLFEGFSIYSKVADKPSFARVALVTNEIGTSAYGTTPRCYVAEVKNVLNEIKNGDLLSRTRSSNWSDVKTVASARGALFDAPGRRCVGFFQNGPTYIGGYSYNLRGWVCRPTGQTVTDSDVQDWLKSIKVAGAGTIPQGSRSTR
ncbi:MAG TPA: hypothetical protein VN802_05070 [Stellaceae bacterium]|nr:hypothetical protein [Stellaceae bacterium]